MSQNKRKASFDRSSYKANKFYNKRRRNKHNSYEDEDGNKVKIRKPRHPPNLRGKEIGFWYRDQATKSRSQNPNERCVKKTDLSQVPSISISREMIKKIKELLDNPEIKVFVNSKIFQPVTDDPYENIAESDFKHEFMNIISGSIEHKLENACISITSCPIVDEELKNALLFKQNDPNYIAMQEFRKKLPSFAMKDIILETVGQNQVILISGETGCGKTTQVAQFLLDDAILSGNGSTCKIACTQPRRISAITVAERVAEERSEVCGQSVGYQIRLERKMPRIFGSIVFCTTGILLQKMESDPSLSEFSHLVIDEIHERDKVSDFLLTMLKQIMEYRRDLKIILMSATLNANQFSEYYDNCPIIHIPGFTYPVEEWYLEDVLQEVKFYNFQVVGRGSDLAKKFNDEIQDQLKAYALNNKHKYNASVLKTIQNPLSEKINVELVEALIYHICRYKPKGAILVFLTGLADISKLHTLLEESGRYPKHRFVIYPLHSKMPTVNQKQIFVEPPPDVRKIIISTNIAETSITINDVVYVIDCGKIKLENYDAETNLNTLQADWVSNANAKQRRGRAGRVQPGVCYHLYSRPRSLLLEDYQKPEMLRTRIEEVILGIKILQLGDIVTFLGRLLNPPDPRVIDTSIRLLQRLNALDSSQTLTPLGYHLARLPMDPQTGKMILMGSLFSCIQPIFSIAASLAFKDAFMFPLGLERDVERCKLELSNGTNSDHLALAEALKRWEEADRNGHGRDFCKNYFLNASTLRLLRDMKKQFAENMYNMKFLCSKSLSEASSNINSDNVSILRSIICSGLYPNVAYIRNKKKKYGILATNEDGKVDFHPGSINKNTCDFISNYFLYYNKLKSSSIFIHDSTMVYPLSLVLFGDNLITGAQDGLEFISVNGLMFRCRKYIADIIMQVRSCLDNLLMYKISHPNLVDWRSNNPEKKILKMISDLISVEEFVENAAFNLDI